MFYEEKLNNFKACVTPPGACMPQSSLGLADHAAIDFSYIFHRALLPGILKDGDQGKIAKWRAVMNYLD